MGYLFEWDPEKAKSNATKHRVTFEEACTVFADPLAILKEERYLLFGASGRGRILVVAFAERPPSTRVISARRAARSERIRYEEKE